VIKIEGSPVFDTIEHASSLFDGVQPITISILHFDYGTESSLAERFQCDEPLFEQILFFRQS